MNIPLFLIGGVLIIAAILDQVWTTMWVANGAGPLSRRLSSGIGRSLQTVGGDRHRILSLIGPLILLVTLLMWIVLLWAGWTLVFGSSQSALIDTQSRGPITWIDRLYFVGYTTFTLGIGDFVPNGGFWQLATIGTTATGMLFITLGVSYVLSVVNAVVDKRSFAGTVTSLGQDGQAFVRAGWDGDNLDDLDLPLNTLSSQLNRLVDQHKAYPILHYYQPADAGRASTVAVVVFDEALTILRFGVPDEDRPNGALIESARTTTRTYLDTLSGIYIRPADTTPSRPALDRLQDADIPTVPDEEFETALDELADQRRYLLGLVNTAGWDWPKEE